MKKKQKRNKIDEKTKKNYPEVGEERREREGSTFCPMLRTLISARRGDVRRKKNIKLKKKKTNAIVY